MPHIQLQIDSWLGLTMAIGFMLPFAVVGISAGYILAGFILDRLGKTVLGTHVRHVLTHIAPAKRFEATDRDIIERTIIDSIRRGRLNLKDYLK